MDGHNRSTHTCLVSGVSSLPFWESPASLQSPGLSEMVPCVHAPLALRMLRVGMMWERRERGSFPLRGQLCPRAAMLGLAAAGSVAGGLRFWGGGFAVGPGIWERDEGLEAAGAEKEM